MESTVTSAFAIFARASSLPARGVALTLSHHLRTCTSFTISLPASVRRHTPQLLFVSRSISYTSRIARFAASKSLHTTRSSWTAGTDMADNKDEALQKAMATKADLIKKKLEEVYPIAPVGFLDHTDNFTLLVAVVLSAQCLDTTVNAVTPTLFAAANTPDKMRKLGVAKIRDLIKRIGLADRKAKALVGLSEMLCEKHDGAVPQTFADLESLPGVGHKTASVVMMQAFKHPAFPVDTHIHRLACRWGCGHPKSVAKTEQALKTWFPDPNSWGELHVRIILFGREHCPAINHDMDQCPICSFAATAESRALCKSFPRKFVPAASHKNPFEVRLEQPESKSKRRRQVKGSDFEEMEEVETGPKGVKVKKTSGKAAKKEDKTTTRTTTVKREQKSAIATKEEAVEVEQVANIAIDDTALHPRKANATTKVAIHSTVKRTLATDADRSKPAWSSLDAPKRAKRSRKGVERMDAVALSAETGMGAKRRKSVTASSSDTFTRKESNRAMLAKTKASTREIRTNASAENGSRVKKQRNTSKRQKPAAVSAEEPDEERKEGLRRSKRLESGWKKTVPNDGC